MRIDGPQITGSFSLNGDGVQDLDVFATTSSLNLATASLATTGSNIFVGTQTISGSIIPAVNNTYDLGTATQQFRDLYLSSASLYIDGTKVLSSTTQELQITTDGGQSFKILEAGSDTITLQSADGNITLASSGGGDVILDPTNGVVALKGTVTVYSGNKVISSDGNAIHIGDDIVISGSILSTGTPLVSGSEQISSLGFATTGSNTFNGNLTVTGYIDTQELRTTYISSSILYRSGSTKFGDELTDTHDFTGSLNVSGSLTITDNVTISNSERPYFIAHTNSSGEEAGIKIQQGSVSDWYLGTAQGTSSPQDLAIRDVKNSRIPFALSSSTGAATFNGIVGVGVGSSGYQLQVLNNIGLRANSQNFQAIKGTGWGYDTSSYRVVMLGDSNTSNSTTVSIGYDPSSNSNSAFSGDGREILFRRGAQFVTPNSGDTAFNLYNLVLLDGKVGIGLNNPSDKLSIKSDTGDAGINLESVNAGQTLRIDQNSIRTTTNSSLTIFTNNTSSNGIHINTSGDVSLGHSNPQSRLDVRGDLFILKTTTSNANFGGPVIKIGDSTSEVGMSGGITFTELLSNNPNNVTMGLYYDGKLNRIHITGPSDTESTTGENLINATKHLTILRDTGVVGIGESSPSIGKLHVSGKIYSTTEVQGGNTIIKSDATFGAVIGSNASSRGVVISRDATPSTYPDIVLNSSGLVGVGTPTPDGKLDVVGDISYFGNTNNSVFVVRNNGSYIGGGGSGSSLIVQYGGQNIATLSNTGTGQRDAILSMRDEGVVKVRIAANNSRGGDTIFNGGGNVAIGLDTASRKLSVGGDFVTSGDQYNNSGYYYAGGSVFLKKFVSVGDGVQTTLLTFDQNGSYSYIGGGELLIVFIDPGSPWGVYVWKGLLSLRTVQFGSMYSTGIQMMDSRNNLDGTFDVSFATSKTGGVPDAVFTVTVTTSSGISGTAHVSFNGWVNGGLQPV